MKHLAIIATALMGLTSTPVAAEIAPTLVRSNVLTCDGVSASGFKLIGGEVQNFVSSDAAAKHTFCSEVTVVPASVDIYNLAEVQSYLQTLGITDTNPRMRGGNEVCQVDGFSASNCPAPTITKAIRW